MPENGKKLRCRHCHLTISAEELGTGDCPECFERDGIKRYDFEEISAPGLKKTQYRCEDCGAIIPH